MELVRKTKSGKNPVKLIALFIIIVLFVVLALSLLVGIKLTKPSREKLLETPNMYGLIFEDLSFTSQKDDLSLSGWWIPAQLKGKTLTSRKTVIFAHGYGDSRTMQQISALNLAKRLTSEGYNVLTFDFRASGKSEGKTVTLGEFEKYDLLSAIDFAKTEKGSNAISLLGWSMGAATVILAGAESKDVGTIIADSPYAELSSYLTDNLPHWSHLPSVPFTSVIMKLTPLVTGVNIDHVVPYQAASQFGDQRLLLIHSKTDEAIPFQESEKIYQSLPAGSKSDLWLTSGGGHIESYLTDKLAYETKVLNFLSGK